MSDDGNLDALRSQYETYPFPVRDPEDEKRRLGSNGLDLLEKINYHCYGGRHSFHGFRVLVAGGGTGDATILLAEQLRERNGEIVHVDLSEASIAIAKERAAVRKLTNIRWLRGSLLDLPDHPDIGSFDYINCLGVLHHLESPERGLEALASVLKPDGCLLLMLYGKYGRTGIYHMQEVFRSLADRSLAHDERVRTVRTVLRDLPRTSWLAREFKGPDYAGLTDIDLFDIFLHSADRPYTVPDIHRLLESANLHFVDFCTQKLLYRPEFFLRDAQALERIRHLEMVERQAVAELIAGNISLHVFYAAPGPRALPRVDQEDNVPFFQRPAPSFLQRLGGSSGNETTLTTIDGMPITLTPGPCTWEMARRVDGVSSLATICERVRAAAGTHAPNHELIADFRPAFELLRDLDIMLLRHESVPPFKSINELQAPVAALYGTTVSAPGDIVRGDWRNV